MQIEFQVQLQIQNYFASLIFNNFTLVYIMQAPEEWIRKNHPKGKEVSYHH